MSHPPPSSPPGTPPRKHSPSAPPLLNDDFADFEGDPTSINQIPQAQQAQQGRPSAPQISGSQSPGQFASASPSLSHISSPSGQQYGTNPGLSGTAIPAQSHGHQAAHAHAASHGHQSHAGHQSHPGHQAHGHPSHASNGGPQAPQMLPALAGQPLVQVSGVIAQPTPYVSRSRIYAFVVDETGSPIEL